MSEINPLSGVQSVRVEAHVDQIMEGCCGLVPPDVIMCLICHARNGNIEMLCAVAEGRIHLLSEDDPTISRVCPAVAKKFVRLLQ